MSLWRCSSPKPLLKYAPLNAAKDVISFLLPQRRITGPLRWPKMQTLYSKEINHQDLLKNLRYTTRASDNCIYITQDKLQTGKCQTS